MKMFPVVQKQHPSLSEGSIKEGANKNKIVAIDRTREKSVIAIVNKRLVIIFYLFNFVINLLLFSQGRFCYQVF
jgi:hypothetical protein